MTNLVKYNAARTALAEAHRVDEVKDIRDKAEAMAAYARQAKDTEMIQWVTEIKVRAERRAGQMLAEMPKAKGELRNSSRSHDVTATKTLADIGISKNESSRWQKLAAVSDEKFEHAVAAAKEVAGEVTTAAMLRAAKPAHVEPEDADYSGPSEAELQALHDAAKADLDVVMALLESDDPKAELLKENERQRMEIATLKSQRDGYMNQANELIRRVKSLRKMLDKAQGK